MQVLRPAVAAVGEVLAMDDQALVQVAGGEPAGARDGGHGDHRGVRLYWQKHAGLRQVR